MTANVALTDTFDQWRVKTNELIVGTQSDGMANIIKTTDTTNSTSNTTGSIITAGGVGIAKSAHIGGDLKVWGDVTTVGDTTISGNLTFGDATTDQITFTADINSSVIPNANHTFDIGNTLNQWANTYTGHLGVTQKTDSGKTAVTITSTDVDQIAISVAASQTTADVLDIVADAVTTAAVIDIQADNLTTGSGLYIDSDSDSTGIRSIASIIQNHASAVNATTLHVQNDSTGMGVDIRGGIGTGAAGAGKLRLSTAETTVVDGDVLGMVQFMAPLEAGGTDAVLVAACIQAEADDTFAADNNATELVFKTAASEAATEKVRITSDGKLGVGTAAPASLLDVRGTVQVGVDGQGYDTKFFGDTASAYMLWDTDVDDLILAGGAGLIVPDGQFTLGSTAVTATAAEINGHASTGKAIAMAIVFG